MKPKHLTTEHIGIVDGCLKDDKLGHVLEKHIDEHYTKESRDKAKAAAKAFGKLSKEDQKSEFPVFFETLCNILRNNRTEVGHVSTEGNEK